MKHALAFTYSQLWLEEHVCSKVMTVTTWSTKTCAIRLSKRMTGILEVDVLGTTSSQGLVKYLHQQQCDSHTPPLLTMPGFRSEYVSCKMHCHIACTDACCNDWTQTVQHQISGGLNTT